MPKRTWLLIGCILVSSVVIGYAVFALWPKTYITTFRQPLLLTGSQAAGLSSAVSYFEDDKHIPSKYKDLRNYDIAVSEDAASIYVHFHPHRAAHEIPSLGCCTSLGMEVSYRVDSTTYKVNG